jgi:hypothetical protein
MWKIIDDNGEVHSGSEDEMNMAWEVMTTDTDTWLENNQDISRSLYRVKCDDYITDWVGDLQLVEIHNTFR